ncbi:MAG: uroporphyrinogen-III synthase, partial [Campylobacteraceae bacterium]|nr:uroporphyrinogen-III synthase [Campylobacteraceae bacterium]
FVGQSSHGDDFALELKDILKHKNVLYIRAQTVVSNLVKILKDYNVNIDELITYKTTCNQLKEHIDIPDHSIIIFSSPSTIKCFFKLYEWNKTYEAIAIGKTTASYLPNHISCQISPSQSIEECIKLAKSLL